MRRSWAIKALQYTSATIFFLLLTTGKVFANPYFYITGSTTATTGELESYTLRLNSDSTAIGVMQVAVGFNSSYFNTSSISISNSNCSLWAPANSIPPGKDYTSVAPYFYNSTAVFSCGFMGSGYNSADGQIAVIKLTPSNPASTSLTLSNAYFAFLGSSITPGAMSSFDVTIVGAPTPTETPTPNPSVTPTATVAPTATPAPTSSQSAGTTITPTPIVNTTTLFDDVTVTDVTDSLTTGSSGTTSTGASGSELEVVEQSNAVPAAPSLEPRAAATPFVPPEINYQAIDGGEVAADDGEVLSIQGLRDLLIPGKSKADRTVVMINFISLFAFIALLAMMLWRMSMNKRASKLKAEHIHELVTGELAALESKMQIIKEKQGAEQFQEEFSDAINEILGGFGDKKDKKK